MVMKIKKIKPLGAEISYIDLSKTLEKLEEAFTPRIKKMLSKKVLKEMEDE